MFNCDLCNFEGTNKRALVGHERGNPHKERVREQVAISMTVISNEITDVKIEIPVEEKEQKVQADTLVEHAIAPDKPDPTNELTQPAMETHELLAQYDIRLVNIIKERIGVTDMNPQRLDVLINMLIISLNADLSNDPFPVNLDDLAAALGYRIDNLTTQLKDNFDEKTDYIIFPDVSGKLQSDNKTDTKRGRPRTYIRVTNDCAKELCTMRRNDIGRYVRKYFLIMEKLVKDYIRNPRDSALSFLRKEIKERVNPRLIHAESYKREAIAIRDTVNKDVIYIYQIHAQDLSGRLAYTYGITYKFGDRGNQHRSRYKCECTLVKWWTCQMPRSDISRFETSIGHFAGRIGTRENYMDSRETFVVEIADAESLPAIITFIEDTIPPQHESDLTLELKMLVLARERERDQMEYKREQQRMDHEYRMRKLELAPASRGIRER